MQELRNAIEKYGMGIGSDIVKVDMFLNHRIDTGLLFKMGQELAEYFREEKPDLVLTVEASGIALALTVARELDNLPVVFAKKGSTVLQSPDTIQAKVYSFTHKQEYLIHIDKKYLPSGSRVLIIDDFLADGHASLGMIELCEKCGCQVCGIGIAVEKGFMPGGKKLRERKIKLKSLVVVTGIRDGKIILAEEE